MPARGTADRSLRSTWRTLRADPLFKLAIGRAPESGRDLCSQPTMSRLENAPSRVEVARMSVDCNANPRRRRMADEVVSQDVV